MKSENQRSCGSCTACCDGWLQIEVRGHHIHPGNTVPVSVSNIGVSIYSERPQKPCREFVFFLRLAGRLKSVARMDASGQVRHDHARCNFIWRGLPSTFS